MLNRNQYFIKERVGFLKLCDVYDIIDPLTNGRIGQAREEVSGLVKFFRLLINKSLMPARVVVYEGAEETPKKRLFSIKRGVAILRPKVGIYDATGVSLGFLKSKLFTLGGAFRVFTADGTEVALLKGDWKGWNFRFLSGDSELGVVTKKWAGLGKELFTSADNYVVSINGAPSREMSILLLASGLAVDTVLKEKK